MSTFFTVLAVIALALAILVLLAPKAFARLMPARHTRTRAVVLYLILAMGLGFAARLSAGPAEETAGAEADFGLNATAFNATAAQERLQPGNVAPLGVPGSSGSQAAGNATGPEKDKSFMDQAQETITRAANATREFGSNVAEQAGEIGSELIEGAGEAGRQFMDSAKETTDELLNNK